MKKKWCLGSILALVALAAAGCHSKKHEFESPYRGTVAQGAPVFESMAEAVAARHTDWSSLQVLADIRVDQGRHGRARFDANLLVEFPDKVRLRGSRAPLGTLFELISVGNDLHVYFNRDGVLFSGPREDLRPEAGVLRLAGTDALVRALLAESDLASRLRQHGTWQVRERPGHWLVWTQEATGEWQVWVVRKSDYLVEETLLGLGDGAPRARIQYWRYSLEGTEPFPRLLEIRLADPDIQVRVEVESVKRDPALKAAVFDAPRADKEKRYPLSLLQFEAPSGS